ncbi:MAG: prenyltransferase [Candidatus Methanoperedenaceae archaeon]|nr:MAG: prenyltransferase [Candidatus Methanoperedenaceae archaeon]
MNSQLTSTIKLLTTSVPVAISGVFRLYIAFLFLGIAPQIYIYLAGFLVIYSTYTFDRALENEEDKINRKELAASRKDIALFVCIVSLIVSTILLYREGLTFMAFLPFVIGYVYSKGISLGKHKLKLKGNFGVKNLIVSSTWGIFIAGIALHMAGDYSALIFVFPFFMMKSFINTVIWDFRDVKGDGAAGIKTLPIWLGEKKTRKLLQLMHITLHFWIAVAMIYEYIFPEIAILLMSSFAGIINTICWTRPNCESDNSIRKTLRNTLVNGEFMLAVVLKKLSDY